MKPLFTIPIGPRECLAVTQYLKDLVTLGQITVEQGNQIFDEWWCYFSNQSRNEYKKIE